MLVPELLFGPYQPPALRKRMRVSCLDGDCDVVITGWSGALLELGRSARPLMSHGKPRRRSSAGRGRTSPCHPVTSRAQALGYWWGSLQHDRDALAEESGNHPHGQRGAAAALSWPPPIGAALIYVRSHPVSKEVCDLRRRIATEKNFATRLTACQWTAEELALLATHSNEAIAQRTGRSRDAVRLMRARQDRISARAYAPPTGRH